MPLFQKCPFEELVAQATSEKNVTDDWGLILDICDKAVNYEEGPKLIMLAIIKRLYSNVPRVVMQALLLLDSCVKNCGRRFHLEVSSRNFITEVRKLLQKMHPGTVDKLKSLIKKWAENDFKDDSELGLIPSLYYKLKSEGVQFHEEIPEKKPVPALCTNPDAVSSQEEEEDIVKAIALSLKETKRTSTFSNDVVDTTWTSEPVKIELLKVRALYDFEAVEDNELTIKTGEVIVVIDKSNESWWKGSNQRGEGYFPVSFITEDLKAAVESVEEEEVKLPEAVITKIEEKPAEIDEQKIQLALHLLTETDPTDECPDDETLLALERDCYAMTPLIEEKLQKIDKKFTVLNSLNDEIMKAIQMFYKLTRDSAAAVSSQPSQYVYNYNVPTDATQSSQQPQDTVPHTPTNFQSSATGPPARVMDGMLYIPSGYLPNLTNLSMNQIRQNVASIPFAHPQPVHYGTLPSKLNNSQQMPNVVTAFPDVPYTVVSSGQDTAKPNNLHFAEDAESRTITSANNSTTYGTPANNSTTYGTPANNSTTYGTPANNSTIYGTPSMTLSGPNYQNYSNGPSQRIPNSATTTNVLYAERIYNDTSATLTPHASPEALPTINNQQLPHSVTQAAVSTLETLTGVAKQASFSGPSNSSIVTNAFPASAIIPDNVMLSNERSTGNVTGQNGSVM